MAYRPGGHDSHRVGEEGRRARFTHAIAAIRAVSRPEMSNVVGEADDQAPGPGWNARLATTAAPYGLVATAGRAAVTAAQLGWLGDHGWSTRPAHASRLAGAAVHRECGSHRRGCRRRTAIAQACSRRRARRLSCRPVRAVSPGKNHSMICINYTASLELRGTQRAHPRQQRR